MKTSKDISQTINSTDKKAPSSVGAPNVNVKNKRTAVYTPVKVKTLSSNAKDLSKLEFVVYENPDKISRNENHKADKRMNLEEPKGSKKKKLRTLAPATSVSKDNEYQTASVSEANVSISSNDMINLGNKICRIKVEPPQLNETVIRSEDVNEFNTVVSISSGVCKTEPVEEGWQEIESTDLEGADLFDSGNLVINVSEGIAIKTDSSEVDFVDRNQTYNNANKKMKVRDVHSSTLADSSKRLFFQCENCGYSTKYKNAVKRHMERCGKDTNSCTRRSCIFPNCHVKFYHVSQMIRHMEVMHSACIGVKNMKFSTLEEFYIWKEKEEISNFTYFTKHRGDSHTKNGLYTVYICQSDGSNKGHRRKDEPARLTNRKFRKGTVKTGATCPSRMFVTVHKGEVNVKYFFSHNHELKFENTQHHPIARKSMEYIQSRFSLGASPKQVQDELRNKAIYREKKEGDGEECIKGQLISLRTLTAIKQEYLSSFRLDKDDANSVFLLVKEWEKKDFNPIMLYKPQFCPIVIGNNNKYFPSQSDVFFIALQTEAQYEVMNSSGSHLLSVDTSFYNGRHGFYLLSLIIHDDHRNAIPVVHFISNSKTKEMIRYFFTSVNERFPHLSIHGVITDPEYNCWEDILSVFGFVSVFHVCQWQIKKEWKKKLESMVEGDAHNEMMRELTVMMEERDDQAVNNMMAEFKSKYENTHPKFVSYFQANIASQPEIWATALRDLSSCNSVTNMYCKGFHDTLEVFFRKSKSKKRIDDLLLLLMRIQETEMKEKHTQELIASNDVISAVHIIECHAKSLDIADADVTDTDGLWKVVCQEDRNTVFDITRLTEECSEMFCTSKCQDLPCGNLCSHMYKCSCVDTSGMCEHIHKVHSGKSNVIIVCSPDSHSIITPGVRKDSIIHKDPIDSQVKQKDMLLTSAYDNLGQLGLYVSEPHIQRELLPHIVEALENLVKKCKEVSKNDDIS